MDRIQYPNIDLNLKPKHTNVYVPRHFSIKEFVHPDIYSYFGEKSIQFMDTRILYTADQLRDLFGPITCNSWSWGENRKFSGLRPFDSKIGAKYSAHKYGKALDLIFRNNTAEEVRQYIKKYPRLESFKYITRIESKVSWLHIDTFTTNKEGILFFNP